MTAGATISPTLVGALSQFSRAEGPGSRCHLRVGIEFGVYLNYAKYKTGSLGHGRRVRA